MIKFFKTGSVAAYLLLATALLSSTVDSQTVRYEVEAAPAVCDGTIDSAHSGFSGSGYCNSLDKASVAVQFSIYVSKAGPATLDIRFANGNPVGRPANILVNGAVTQSGLTFDNTGGWNRYASRTITTQLKAGENSLRIVAVNSQLANIDYLEVTPAAIAARPMEKLGRGVVAVRASSNSVLISWRLLGLDPDSIGFNIYRATGSTSATKLNSEVLTKGTNFLDTTADLAQPNIYTVRPVVNGAEQAASSPFTLSANNAIEPIVRIPIRAGATIKYVWVGDLDGDGEYDYVIDRQSKPQKLEAYTGNGTFLWEVDMGPNSSEDGRIEIGSSKINVGHWDGVTVYDFDSDGRAEVAIRIANGVKFGNGQTFTHSNDNEQFIAFLDGRTGALRASAKVPTDYLSDGPLAARFGVGYLDGVKPHLVAYMKNRKDDGDFNLMMTAWTFGGSSAKMEWKWLRGSQDAPDGHNTRIIDVDGDGIDEVHEIGFCLNGNGQVRYLMGPKGIVHGDRFHIAKMDPTRPGLQGYGVQQNNPSFLLEYYYDARDGTVLWTHNGTVISDVGRGMAGDIDPRYPGMEVWSFSGVYNAQTNQLTQSDATKRPWPHLGLWWDGDNLMELFNDGKIEKWDWVSPGSQPARLETISRYGATTMEGGPNPGFHGDILGDWREEVIVTNADNDERIIFTTNVPSDIRLYTLPHNPAYRNSMTLKGYVQSHHLDFFLGNNMTTPPKPNIRYVGG